MIDDPDWWWWLPLMLVAVGLVVVAFAAGLALWVDRKREAWRRTYQRSLKWICTDCAGKRGLAMKRDAVATAAICDACGHWRMVAELERDFHDS